MFNVVMVSQHSDCMNSGNGCNVHYRATLGTQYNRYVNARLTEGDAAISFKWVGTWLGPSILKLSKRRFTIKMPCDICTYSL